MRALLLSIASAIVASACAKAPDVKASADAKVDADASTDAGRASVPGLPMPQQFPHVVWDAAAADASAR